MNRLGSDVVALAAILGSGAIGGAVTMAAFDRGYEPPVAECASATAVTAPRIVLESAHARHAVIIAPRVRVHATKDCSAHVVVVDERVQADLDRAMAELDESRVKLERVYELQFESRLQEEMARLQEELARLGDDTGR